jgi:hypothetical protein
MLFSCSCFFYYFWVRTNSNWPADASSILQLFTLVATRIILRDKITRVSRVVFLIDDVSRNIFQVSNILFVWIFIHMLHDYIVVLSNTFLALVMRELDGVMI